MAFVQIIEFRSRRIDDILKLDAEWTDRAGSETTASARFSAKTATIQDATSKSCSSIRMSRR